MTIKPGSRVYEGRAGGACLPTDGCLKAHESSPGTTSSTPGPGLAVGQGQSTDLGEGVTHSSLGRTQRPLSPGSLLPTITTVPTNIPACLSLSSAFPLPHLLPSNFVSIHKPEGFKKHTNLIINCLCFVCANSMDIYLGNKNHNRFRTTMYCFSNISFIDI